MAMSQQSNSPTQVPEIPESDKPFYLGIISAILLLVVILVGGIGAYYNNIMLVDYAKAMLTPVFGLVSAAWTWYFGKNHKS